MDVILNTIFPTDLTNEILSYSNPQIWICLLCNVTGADHNGYCSGVDEDDERDSSVFKITEKTKHFIQISFIDAYKLNKLDNKNSIKYFNTHYSKNLKIVEEK